MLERSKRQKFIVNTLTITIALSIAVLAGLLVWRAVKLGAIETAVSEKFAIGPIGLFELGKIPKDGGYQAMIGFLPGTIAYFIIWILIAAVYIFAGGRTSRKKL